MCSVLRWEKSEGAAPQTFCWALWPCKPCAGGSPALQPYEPCVGAAQPCNPMSLALGQPCLPHSSHPSIALGRAGADGDDDDDGGNAALQGSLLLPAAEARLWEGGQMPPGTLEQ